MGVKCLWLGQGGFLFEKESFRIAVDPYLSDIVEKRDGFRRLLPPPLRAEDLKANAVICTHDHLDHYDPVTIREIAKLFPRCLIVGPDSVMMKAKSDGIDGKRFKLLNSGDALKLGPFDIYAVSAVHSDKSAIGLNIRTRNLRIYISGDTEYFPELPKNIITAGGGAIDVVFICINGKLGNMNWEEALSVAKGVKPALVIPMHYGIFAENTVGSEPFIKNCLASGINSMELKLGTFFNI